MSSVYAPCATCLLFACAWLLGVVPVAASAAGAALAVVLAVAAMVAAPAVRAFEVAVEERSVRGAYGEGLAAWGLLVVHRPRRRARAVHGDCHGCQCDRCDGCDGGGCDRRSRPNLTLLHGVLPLSAASRRCALRPSQHTVRNGMPPEKGRWFSALRTYMSVISLRASWESGVLC